MSFTQQQPNVPGVDTSPNSPVMIVHPAVLVDTTNTPVGSTSNPIITQDHIRGWIAAGKAFSVATGRITASGSITGAFSLFNPANSGKTVLVYSVKGAIGNNSNNAISYVTSDPAFTAMTVVNRYAGNANTSVVSATYSNSNQTPTGTTNDIVSGSSNIPLSFLQNGDLFYLPPGNGVAIWINLSGANAWAVGAQWVEI